MEFGCCIGIAHYDQVLSAGYRSIALPGVEISSMDDAAFQSVLNRIQGGPLAVHSVNSFCPPSLRLTGADFDASALEGYARHLFSRASKLGARYVGIGGPASRSTRPGESTEQALEDLKHTLRLLCRFGRDYGITVLLESVCSLECNLVTYTREAADMVRELALPNLGLVYDIYHAHMMGEDPNYILEAADLIRVVHIAQDQSGKRIYLREEKMDEYLPYIRALCRAGYAGECNLESFVGDVDQELPRSLHILEQLLALAK